MATVACLTADVAGSPVVKRYVMVIYTGGTIGMKQGPDGETRKLLLFVLLLLCLLTIQFLVLSLQFAKTEEEVLCCCMLTTSSLSHLLISAVIMVKGIFQYTFRQPALIYN